MTRKAPTRAAALAAMLAAAAITSPAGAAGLPACGGDIPCPVAGGAYRVVLPPGGVLKGAYVFFHGHRGSAAAQMGDRALVETVLARGLAFVAPDGDGGTWSHAGAPRQSRDEIAFVGAVLDDLDRRHGIGPERTVVGGFSQGASMAFYAVCALGGRIAGAVTAAGVFWSPVPSARDCAATPPPMIHFHGRADTVFPLDGRMIGGRWRQGDMAGSLAVLQARAGCSAEPAAAVTVAGIACEGPAGCARGPIRACLYDGGHQIRADWVGAALDRLGLEAEGRASP